MPASPTLAHIPIIAQTALTSPQEKVNALKSGATDIIHKPIDYNELIARVSIHLERHAMLAELRHYRERVQEELETARALQQQLFPQPDAIWAASQQTGLEIAGYCMPSSELGGDMWDCHTLAPTLLSVTTLDVSGHGAGAALNTFRIHSIMQMLGASMSNPAQFMESLSDRLYELLPTGHFVTMFHGVIDLDRRVLRYATAAAPEGWVIPPCGPAEVLDGRDLPLGVGKHSRYMSKQRQFAPGSTLILASDAFTESCNAAGAMPDASEWITALPRHLHAEAQRDWLLERFYAHALQPIPDDLTLICIRWPE